VSWVQRKAGRNLRAAATLGQAADARRLALAPLADPERTARQHQPAVRDAPTARQVRPPAAEAEIARQLAGHLQAERRVGALAALAPDGPGERRAPSGSSRAGERWGRNGSTSDGSEHGVTS
jgi:hypothetical protein